MESLGRAGRTGDGHSLIYPAYDGVVYSLWSQPNGGGPPQQITDFKDGDIFAFAWSQDGKRLASIRDSRSNDTEMISNLRARE